MAIRINENIFSLFVNRNLLRTSKNLDQSFDRLSSGLKINRAGDDPAGLANSNVLRSKINGLQRNLSNCNEGLNLLSVAESSLGNVTDILQRLRELAVRAANSTISDEQRGLIQEEVDSLLEEIQRIGETADYNGKNLLDGSFTNLRLQVGTRMNESIPISIEDSRTSILGSIARATGALAVDGTAISGLGDITINGITVPASIYDETSTVSGETSAIAKAKAINEIRHLTGVTAKADPTVYRVSGTAIQGGALDGATSSLTINGVNIGPIDYLPGDTDHALRERINSLSTMTGIEATIGAGQELILTAKDGRNVEVVTTGSVAGQLGLQFGGGDLNTVQRGTVTLTSPETIHVGGSLTLIGFTAGQSTTHVDLSSAIESLKMMTLEDADAALATIDVAQNQVLARRAALGALESRLNATIDDIQVNIENLTGADSRIRDADFAVETAALTQAQ
ncbi:flagellin, partial [bacterium]|nr:flagellin [bacterium]